MANLRLVTLAVCVTLIACGALYVGYTRHSRADGLTARRESRATTPSHPRRTSRHSHHDTVVEDQTNDIPKAGPNSSDSGPSSWGGDLGVASLGRKQQSPAKENDTKSARRYFAWTPGGHQRRGKHTPAAGDAQMSPSSPSDGPPGPAPYTHGVNSDGGSVSRPGSRGGHRRKRATGPRQCTADVQCAPTECCMEDQLGANPLSLVCVPRQTNGYCGRPKACRYTQNCKPPAERCVLTRVIFHPRFWGVPIGYCATL